MSKDHKVFAMEEGRTSPSVPNNSIMGNIITAENQEILRKGSFWRRIPRNAIPYSNNGVSQIKLAQESKITNNVQEPSEFSGEALDMPPKTDTVIDEASQTQNSTKQATEVDRMVKRISKPRSEAAIWRSYLRHQEVPVPPDKVGIVREPQRIVRKFNIPIGSSSNKKYSKSKRRYKYQHDVAGITNVNQNNTLHAITKSKPVVSYSAASFVNDNLSSPIKSTGIRTSVSKKTASTILPKNRCVNPNWLPSTSPYSSVSVLPSSLPSTPTSVVKPLLLNPPQLSSTNSVDSGKLVISKTVDGSEGTTLSTSESDSEIIEIEAASANPTAAQSSAITSPPKISKPKTIFLQGSQISALKKENEQNFNKFVDMKDKLLFPEGIQAIDSSEVVDLGSPSPEGSNANTLHLKILSGGSLSESGDAEMTDPSVSVNQEESLIRITAPRVSETNVKNYIGQARSITVSHNVNPNALTFRTEPASGNGTISQLQLKPQPSPITVQTATPAPRLVSAGIDKATKTLKSVRLQNGSAPTVGMSDQLKSNNLALLATRQNNATQYFRDMMRAPEEIRVPRTISYPARNVVVVDLPTQTPLVSLLEKGRLVEMTSAVGKGAKVGPTVTMPSSTAQQTNSTSVGKPSTSMNTESPGKRVLLVDSEGRVVIVRASSSPSEPQCKKLKQTESNPANKVKRPSTDSSMCQKIKKQTVKSNNDLMVCDNIIQQQNAAIVMGSTDLKSSSNGSNLELEGVEASDILTNSHVNNSPKVPSVNQKFALQSAFKDWTNRFVSDENGNVPLHKAVLDDDLNQVKRQCLILEARKESVDIRNAREQTPLHLAVWLGCPEIVQYLLTFEAKPELIDYRGNNALHLAVEKTDNFACLQILLNECNCQPFINTLNHDGFSPLHLCAMRNKYEESVALIKQGANVNLRDKKSGRTALFHAVEAHNKSLAKLLLQNGASASLSNNDGESPVSTMLHSRERSHSTAAVTGPVDQSRNMLEED